MNTLARLFKTAPDLEALLFIFNDYLDDLDELPDRNYHDGLKLLQDAIGHMPTFSDSKPQMKRLEYSYDDTGILLWAGRRAEIVLRRDRSYSDVRGF